MRWLLLLFLVPSLMACMEPESQTIASNGKSTAVLGIWDGVVHHERGYEWPLPEATQFVAFGPDEKILYRTMTPLGNCTWAQETRLLSKDLEILYTDQRIVGEGMPFYTWDGGFGNDHQWDWNGKPLETAWGNETTHVSPQGTTWAIQNGSHIQVFGALKGSLNMPDAQMALGDGVMAVAVSGRLQSQLFLFGHHHGAWQIKGPIHKIDLDGAYLYVAGDDATRITLDGRAEMLDIPGSFKDTNDGLFYGQTAYRFQGGIDYYGQSIIGSKLYEFNETDWAYVKATTWEPADIAFTAPLALYQETEEEASLPAFGLLLGSLALIIRRRA